MVFGERARTNIFIHVSHSVTLFLFSLTPQQHGLQERYPALLVLHSTLKVARMPPVFFARRVLSCIFLSFPHFPPHRQHITVVNFMLSLRGCIKSSFIIQYIDLGAALVPQQHYLQHIRTEGRSSSISPSSTSPSKMCHSSSFLPCSFLHAEHAPHSFKG